MIWINTYSNIKPPHIKPYNNKLHTHASKKNKISQIKLPRYSSKQINSSKNGILTKKINQMMITKPRLKWNMNIEIIIRVFES